MKSHRAKVGRRSMIVSRHQHNNLTLVCSINLAATNKLNPRNKIHLDHDLWGGGGMGSTGGASG